MAEIPKDTEELGDQLAAIALGVVFDGKWPAIVKPKSLDDLAREHIQMQTAQIAALQVELKMTRRERNEYRAMVIALVAGLVLLFIRYVAK